MAASGTFASLDLPLTTPEVGASLLVTISFREKQGGFLRLTWKDTQGEQVLSSNFYEGVAMSNQRTLLVPATVIKDGGTLSLQVGDTTLSVQRISLEWVEEHSALVSPEQPEEEVISRLGKTSLASALDGQPAASVSSTLDGAIVSVPIISAPQRIEQGVEFSLQLQGVPRAARLSFEESGLPWGQHFVLWINQQRAGTITPDVPDLEDSGFPSSASQPYVGWRRGSIYLPVALMKPGLNALQLSVENDAPAAGDDPEDDTTSSQPLAVNRLVCQFDYTAPEVIAAASATPVITDGGSTTDSPSGPTTASSADTIATPGASAAAAPGLIAKPGTPTLNTTAP